MGNVLDRTGLHLVDRQYWVDHFTESFRRIYGHDVNLDQNTPDGQWINIMVQAVMDLQDLLAQVYTSFDPDQAIGRVLDQRIAINGIERDGGTFTVTPIEIVTDRSLNLFGLDQSEQAPYTVSDNEGNQFFLIESQIGLAPGSSVFNFRAQNPGAQLVTPNTITTPVTVVIGVTSVNNPTPPLAIGIDEESDEQVKIRRRRSTSQGSQGYHDGLVAALENLQGVNSVAVHENVTGTVDADGIPGHAIWVIISGTADPQLIAETIYRKRSGASGMKGETTYNITRITGELFPVSWDYFVAQNIFITFNATSIDGVTPPNIAAIMEQLPNMLTPGVNEILDINEVATAVQAIDDNALVTNAGLSDGTQQEISLSAAPVSGDITFRYNENDSGPVAWNDSASDIQEALRLVPGLEAIEVSGSFASQSLAFDLSASESVNGLIMAVDNTLEDAGSQPVTVSYVQQYSNTLNPLTKQNQFVLSPSNIIILPMQLLPATTSVSTGIDVQFSAYGGYDAYVYEMVINNSGATIDASTGLYTSGAIPGVTDTVRVTDSLGNTATAQVAVVS